MECLVVDLGKDVDYDASHGLQKSLVARRAAGQISNVLLLLEHGHVITVGRDGQDMDNHLKLPREEIERAGVKVRAVERGGHATYHGPGQLVAYPILQLPPQTNPIAAAKQFADRLELAAHHTLAEYIPTGLSVGGSRAFGVWYDSKKLASSGVKVEASGVTWHGVAINVKTDLTKFGYILPCGFPSDVMTSLQAVLGREVDMGELKQKFVRHFTEEFRLEPRYVSQEAIISPHSFPTA
jgi:lipoate-protein ligase B